MAVSGLFVFFVREETKFNNNHKNNNKIGLFSQKEKHKIKRKIF